MYNRPERCINKLVHIIGDDVEGQEAALESALELVISRPGDWHPELLGEQPRRVMCEGTPQIQDWLRGRELQLVDAVGVDEIMMAVVTTRDPAVARLIEFYVEIGVPVVAIDLLELDVFALNERKLSPWFARETDSHHNLENSGGAYGHFPVESERSVESHFLAGSDSMLSESVSRPTLTLRDGDRCRFTRSRVEKAG